MKLKKFTRNDKTVFYGMVTNAGQPEESENTSTIKMLPTPECDDALQALVKVVGEVMEYTKAYLDGIVITGVSVAYTKRDTRSMVITYRKALDKLNTSHSMVTPSFRIDDPAEGEAGKLETKHSDECIQVIQYAEEFITDPSARQQPELPLNTPEGNGTEEDPEHGKLKIV